jgi:hypothetical protein
MKARVAGHHLPGRAGGGIAVEDHTYFFANTAEHGNFPGIEGIFLNHINLVNYSRF